MLHVRVPVPRCRDCRARTRGDAATVVAGLAGGYWWAWQKGLLPEMLPAGDEEAVLWGLALGGAFAGATVSFFIRMGAVRRRLRQSGGTLRPYDDFPPIAALRARGWDWPSSE